MRNVIVKAIWDWLHGKHPSEDGTYQCKNASLWGVIDEACVGIDDQIDLYALADAIEKAINTNNTNNTNV